MTFIADCRRKGGFLANKFVDAMIFIEEIQVNECLIAAQYFIMISTPNILSVLIEHKLTSMQLQLLLDYFN